MSRMRLSIAIALGFVLQSAALGQTFAAIDLLLVVPLAGDERGYEAFVRKQAHLCSSLPCPQHYIVLQPLTSTNAVWRSAFVEAHHREPVLPSSTGELWTIAVYRSAADMQKAHDWEENDEPHHFRSYHRGVRAWMGGGSSAPYRPELSVVSPWIIGETPFLVITMTRNRPLASGAVFSRFGDSWIVVSLADSRDEAIARATEAGPDSVALAVRPDLSFPEKSWIVSNPGMWETPVSQRDIRRVIASDQTPQ